MTRKIALVAILVAAVVVAAIAMVAIVVAGISIFEHARLGGAILPQNLS